LLIALADAFEHEVVSVADALADATNELEQFSHSMHAAADESGQRAHAAAAVAEATTEGASSVAFAVEEMLTTIGDISSQVVEASKVVAEAAGRANVAVTNSEDLAADVQYIDRVVALITSIAGQTNLLALNAMIEAARAAEGLRIARIALHHIGERGDIGGRGGVERVLAFRRAGAGGVHAGGRAGRERECEQ